MQMTQAHPDMMLHMTMIPKNSYSKKDAQLLFRILLHNLSKCIT